MTLLTEFLLPEHNSLPVQLKYEYGLEYQTEKYRK